MRCATANSKVPFSKLDSQPSEAEFKHRQMIARAYVCTLGAICIESQLKHSIVLQALHGNSVAVKGYLLPRSSPKSLPRQTGSSQFIVKRSQLLLTLLCSVFQINAIHFSLPSRARGRGKNMGRSFRFCDLCDASQSSERKPEML